MKLSCNDHAMIRFEKKEKTFALFHTIPIIFSEPHYRPFDLTNNGESSSTSTDIGTSNHIMQGEP